MIFKNHSLNYFLSDYEIIKNLLMAIWYNFWKFWNIENYNMCTYIAKVDSIEMKIPIIFKYIKMKICKILITAYVFQLVARFFYADIISKSSQDILLWYKFMMYIPSIILILLKSNINKIKWLHRLCMWIFKYLYVIIYKAIVLK